MMERTNSSQLCLYALLCSDLMHIVRIKIVGERWNSDALNKIL